MALAFPELNCPGTYLRCKGYYTEALQALTKHNNFTAIIITDGGLHQRQAGD